MITKGETSIESHDNAYLDNRASAEGLVSSSLTIPDFQIYLNPYDLGRKQNLLLFFNITPSAYPPITLLFPFLIPPASTGWSYPRRPLPPASTNANLDIHEPGLAAGLVGRHAELGEIRGKYVMGGEEGLTDDEEGGGGWVE